MDQIVENRNRIEFGHQFNWNAEIQAWETTNVHKVLVRAPDALNPFWSVSVPRYNTDYRIQGENAEQRAFSIAEGYARLKD